MYHSAALAKWVDMDAPGGENARVNDRAAGCSQRMAFATVCLTAC